MRVRTSASLLMFSVQFNGGPFGSEYLTPSFWVKVETFPCISSMQLSMLPSSPHTQRSIIEYTLELNLTK